VPDVEPGEHTLLARAPGFVTAGALSESLGDGRLNAASLYLEAKPREAAADEHLSVVARAVGTQDEATTVSACLLHFGWSGLFVIREATPGVREIVVFAADGKRRGVVAATPDAAERVAALLLEDHRAPPSAGSPAWYEARWLWIVAGAVVVAGGVTAGYFAFREPPVQRIDIFLGRP
jgi:hypothetical protein